MRIHIQWVPALVFISLVIIAISFGGLAGDLSFFISLFLPIYAVLVLIHMVVSWYFYAWHQDFSTNHPRKGESIHFSMKIINESGIPLCGGLCYIVTPGSKKTIPLPVGYLPGSKDTVVYESEIKCPYRGTYTAGIESIVVSTPLGIIRTETQIFPQVFYVYPELCEIDSSIEKYAIASGATIPATAKGGGDFSVFEYTVPLRDEIPGARIAWKRWAATGIPAAIVNGRSRSKGITLVLDLYPCDVEGSDAITVTETEKLEAEDVAVSAAFSVVQYFSSHAIPVVFVTGGAATGETIDSLETFKELYNRSTGILFTDTAFPAAAFSGESVAILCSTRPLTALCQSYEQSLRSGTEPFMFLCPPRPRYAVEQQYAEDLLESQPVSNSYESLYVADVQNGIREVSYAFKW